MFLLQGSAFCARNLLYRFVRAAQQLAGGALHFGRPPQLQLGPSTSMQNELAAPFVMTEELRAAIIQADEERHIWACDLALCEMTPDAAKYVTSDRWFKALDAKYEEIFARLN
jgi:hypothetical protein